jgi:hypothetical protein
VLINAIPDSLLVFISLVPSVVTVDECQTTKADLSGQTPTEIVT